MKNIDRLAKIVWEYHLMHQPLKKSNAILALGSHDLRVADRAAELYLQNFAPLLIFSGGIGRLTEEFEKPEAEVFTDRAVELGVPREKILLEARSTNTGENIKFTKKLLEEKGIEINSFILVQKPHMERRTYATFKKLWSEKDFVVTSPQISYNKYFLNNEHKEIILNAMVGDTQRIIEYPKLGYSIPQEIPDDVRKAYEELMSLGYNKHVIK